MDMVKDSNNRSKKAMKLLISLSAISFVFSYSSLLVPFLVNSFTHVYFSAFIKQSSSFTSSPPLDKTYVFLLFNGILVIIVKNSGLIGSTKSSDVVVSANTVGKTTPSSKLSFDSKQPVIEREYSHSQQLIMMEVNKIVEEAEELSMVEAEEADLNRIEEEEEEEDEELPGSDEFKKICEDFIRRVKEEIMSEAR